jgi:hypothetical protein
VASSLIYSSVISEPGDHVQLSPFSFLVPQMFKLQAFKSSVN